jgi:dCMP deaminase
MTSISWNNIFMNVAIFYAQKSKDPNTKVGACIVNGQNQIIGCGFNSFPNGCANDSLPWARTAESDLDTKYFYVCHAEMNAIMASSVKIDKSCTIYTTRFPCCECVKLLIQSNIGTIIYLDEGPDDLDKIAAHKMFNLVDIKLSKYNE